MKPFLPKKIKEQVFIGNEKVQVIQSDHFIP